MDEKHWCLIVGSGLKIGPNVMIITLNLPWNDGKLLQYDSNLLRYFNPRNNRVFTVVIYHGKLLQYFYKIGP
jgi:hypothetical protein